MHNFYLCRRICLDQLVVATVLAVGSAMSVQLRLEDREKNMLASALVPFPKNVWRDFCEDLVQRRQLPTFGTFWLGNVRQLHTSRARFLPELPSWGPPPKGGLRSHAGSM